MNTRCEPAHNVADAADPRPQHPDHDAPTTAMDHTATDIAEAAADSPALVANQAATADEVPFWSSVADQLAANLAPANAPLAHAPLPSTCADDPEDVEVTSYLETAVLVGSAFREGSKRKCYAAAVAIAPFGNSGPGRWFLLETAANAKGEREALSFFAMYRYAVNEILLASLDVIRARGEQPAATAIYIRGDHWLLDATRDEAFLGQEECRNG